MYEEIVLNFISLLRKIYKQNDVCTRFYAYTPLGTTTYNKHECC